jgi:hypothetical protein
VCFVETMSLDGETNLKVRQCPRETRPLSDPARLAALVGTLECEAPNSRLYVFDGALEIMAGLDDDSAGKPTCTPTHTQRQ